MAAIAERQKVLGADAECHTDRLLCALIKLVGDLMQSLTIDPRLFAKEATWGVVVLTGRVILDSCVLRATPQRSIAARFMR